jgi:hypothetical protein
MTPKAMPDAPLELLARQCHADADVEAAVAIVAPINIAMRKRFMIALPEFMHQVLDYHEASSQLYEATSRLY